MNFMPYIQSWNISKGAYSLHVPRGILQNVRLQAELLGMRRMC